MIGRKYVCPILGICCSDLELFSRWVLWPRSAEIQTNSGHEAYRRTAESIAAGEIIDEERKPTTMLTSMERMRASFENGTKTPNLITETPAR